MVVAAKIAQAELEQPTRKFTLVDLDRHGRWILPRLLKVWPHLTERTLIGFLRGILFQNDYLFLYQDHGVALATYCRNHPLEPKPHVHEIFVLSEPGFEEQAASFYLDFQRWAKSLNLDTIVVEEMTDVPHELVRETLGRVFERKVLFARL